MQHEITVVKPLLDQNGHLTEAGWARSQALRYQRSAIKANPLRIKEWDYYLVMDDHRAVALTVADNSYMGVYSVSLLDFESGFQHTNSVMTLLPLGKTNLPESSEKGATIFKNDHLKIQFEVEKGKRHIFCEYWNFLGNKNLRVSFDLRQYFEDTMVIATPWKEDAKAFYYNQKINCMPAHGYYDFDGQRYDFNKEETFGTLDWGRGVWTRDNTWYWGSGNKWIDGKRFGFNFGYGFGDTSAASENVLFYDGIAHKLDHVTFKMADEKDLMLPWKITDNANRLNLNFMPIMDRSARTSALIISSDQHQVFGKLSGSAILDNGKSLRIPEMTCFFEKVRNIW